MHLTLKKPDLEHYTNGDHLEFHETTATMFVAHPDAMAPELLVAYKAAVEQEASIYQWIRKGEFTNEKAEINRMRRKAYAGLSDLIRLLAKHFDPMLANCARRAKRVMDSYRSIYDSRYDSATSIIDAVVDILRSPDYAGSMEALHLTMWLTELTRLNTLFKNYVEKTEDERVQKPKITMVEARVEVDRAMREIAAHLTALIDLRGEADFRSIVEAFNVHVGLYNLVVRERYGRLHAKIDLSTANVSSIDVQAYTGQPVYVIPSVSLRPKGEEEGAVLVFGHDFNLAYRNNVEPGTATIVVTGVGKYKGVFTTRFTIKEMEG